MSHPNRFSNGNKMPSLYAVLCALAVLLGMTPNAHTWPAASLESRHMNCLGCHEQANTWADTSQIVIDIVDPKTGVSFRQPDGSFRIEVARGSERKVKSVFGVTPSVKFPPDMVGWLFVSPDALQTAHESDLKFAPGWSVNRPFCGKRLIEEVPNYPGDKLAAITMTVRPSDTAHDADVSLQVLLKSYARGLSGEYIERVVHLDVTD